MRLALSCLGFLLCLGCGRAPEGALSAEPIDDPTAAGAERPNVLFIWIDDLRPVLGCYGDERARTPRIDGLAERGVVFERAYCPVSLCAPSRASVLTGLRPETHGVTDLRTHYRERLPDLVALPELFQRAGYTTLALGKVHHGRGDLDDDERAWSAPPWRAVRGPHYFEEETLAEIERVRAAAVARGDEREALRRVYFPWEAPDVEDEVLMDGQIAARAIELLEEHREEPFFLAVGFVKPHLPFVAPRRYFDLHPEGAYAPDPMTELPEGAPPFAGHRSGELRGIWSIPQEGPIDPEVQAEMVRAYYACASFADAQVGRLLDALERLELDQRTIVVVLGDHGFHLGDKGLWGKNTNYELGVHSPLVVSAPGRGAKGRGSRGLVEFEDIYPSLAELCGLDPPAELEGLSFVPLLEEPDRPWKSAVFHRYSRGYEHEEVLGRAVRTERHRYVEWQAPGWPEPVRELYDYEGPGERVNLADHADHAEEQARLEALLEAGWRAALPR